MYQAKASKKSILLPLLLSLSYMISSLIPTSRFHLAILPVVFIPSWTSTMTLEPLIRCYRPIMVTLLFYVPNQLKKVLECFRDNRQCDFPPYKFWSTIEALNYIKKWSSVRANLLYLSFRKSKFHKITLTLTHCKNHRKTTLLQNYFIELKFSGLLHLRATPSVPNY